MQFEEIVVASNNINKINEIRQILGDYIKIFSMQDIGFFAEILEDGLTFYENALIKARAVAEFTSMPVLADDSGLIVNALNGKPGVYSARFAGENSTDQENNDKLLKCLRGCKDRSAKFVCQMVLLLPDKSIVSVSGETHGEILRFPLGSGGFGYDSIFFSNDLKVSFAQATVNEKNTVSHRSKAVQALKEKIQHLVFWDTFLM